MFALIGLFAGAAGAVVWQPAAVEAHAHVDTEMVRARSAALLDAVNDSSRSPSSLKSQAATAFGEPGQTTIVLPVGRYRRMDRESVSGTEGTIENMQQAADQRLQENRGPNDEPPPADLTSAMSAARNLKDEKRMAFDDEGSLTENQMGVFRYVHDQATAGVVRLNELLRGLAALVGQNFAYATIVHEAAHERDHKSGQLKPETEIESEVRAFRSQYHWIKRMDPNGERMLTLHATLKIILLRTEDPKKKEWLTRAIKYMEHLSDVVATNGTDRELRALVKKLGYEGHQHGRAPDSPPSA